MDLIISSIQSGFINPSNISFDLIRSTSGRSIGLWGELGRGRAILSSCDHLDQYVYSYGPMTRDQWHDFLPRIDIPDGNFVINDYGCGQGLGLSVILDNVEEEFYERLQLVRLIEPSAIALLRAESVVCCYLNGRANVLVINKLIDELVEADISSGEVNFCIHIFSNVMDIEGFDYLGLFEKILSCGGRHIFLMVSSSRDREGGNSRFEGLENALLDVEGDGFLSVVRSSGGFSNIPDGREYLYWELHLEV